MSEYAVTLYVDVDDEQEMWDTARNSPDCVQRSDADAAELLGPRDEPDVGNCLRMILDPGTSPAGCTINDSSASATL